MSEGIFLPYKYEWEALEITINRILLDDKEVNVDECTDTDHHSINLVGLEDEWVKLTVIVSVSDPNNQLEKVLPKEESIDKVSVKLIIKNKYTRTRDCLTLKCNKEGQWIGDLSFLEGDVYKFTELACYAVLNSDITEVDGFASNSHDRIAGSSVWHIYTDSVPPLPGGALNSEWRNFAEDENPELNKRSDCVWYLDISDSESPRLLLNEGVPGFRTTLEVSKKTGRAARVRDALSHSVLQGVLNELAVFCLSQSNGIDALDELPDWQRKMLLTLARRDNTSSEEAKAEEWLASWKASDQVPLVLNEITTSVQRHLNIFHSSEYLVKSVERVLDDE